MKKRSISIVLLLSMLLSLFPSYAYPAVFGSDENICGIEEHTHNDDCYSIVSETKELICDGKHIHDKSCYMDKWVCEVEDSEHTHSDECYQKELVCELDKLEHTHSSDCYDVETDELVCEKDELEHTHSDSCYTILPVIEFTCELEEHTHTEDCFLQVEEEEVEQDENQSVIENEENEENQEIEDNNDQTIIDDENNNQEIIDDDNQTTIEDENNQGIIDDENDSNIVDDNNQSLLEEEIGKDSPHDKQNTVKSTVAVKKFVNAAEKLLDDAEYNRVSEDELFEETLEVRFLGNSLTKDEASTQEVVTTVMALSNSVNPIVSSTDWTSMGLSSGYKGFKLWAPLGQKPGGWLQDIDVYGNNKYIYSGNGITPYFNISAYISDSESSLYIAPGTNYKLIITEAGVLNYGSGWDVTVSSGKNYTYRAMVGSPSVTKGTFSYSSSSTWSYLQVNKVSLGEVIKVGAYVYDYYLKCGWPTVRIYNDTSNVTDKTISVDSGSVIPISAKGYLDSTEWNGTIKLVSSDTSKAVIENGELKFAENISGSVKITANWYDDKGYFKATAYTYYTIRDLSKVVMSIEVEDYKDIYYRTETFVNQGTILVHMGDGSTKSIPLNKSYVSNFLTNIVGEKTLTVTYEGCTTTYNINVIWHPVTIDVTLDNSKGDFGNVRYGTIKLTGDVDYVLLPNDETHYTPSELDTRYIFTDEGTFEFKVVGKGEDEDTDIVEVTGIDKDPPKLSYELAEDGSKVTLKSYDEKSGLKTVEYFELSKAINISGLYKTEEDAWKDEYSLKGVASGVYRVVAIDWAGNSTSVEIPVSVDIPKEKPPFKIYVPAHITMNIAKDGTVTTTPDETWIYNGVETEAIRVKSVDVTALNGWTLVNPDSNFESFEKDSKNIGLTINGTSVNEDGSVNIEPESWIIQKDSRMQFVLDAKASTQSTDLISENVMKINFTADWYDDSVVLDGEKYTMTIVDVKNATIANGLTKVETDAFGKVTYLPRVIVKGSWCTFEGWKNAITNEKITVGMTLKQDIKITPIVTGEEPKGTVTVTPESAELIAPAITYFEVVWDKADLNQKIKEVRTTANLSASIYGSQTSTKSVATEETTIKEYLGITSSSKMYSMNITIKYQGTEILYNHSFSVGTKFSYIISSIKSELEKNYGLTKINIVMENNKFSITNVDGSSIIYTINTGDEIFSQGYIGQTSSGSGKVKVQGLSEGVGKVTIVMVNGVEIEREILVRPEGSIKLVFEYDDKYISCSNSDPIWTISGTSWGNIEKPQFTVKDNNYVIDRYLYEDDILYDDTIFTNNGSIKITIRTSKPSLSFKNTSSAIKHNGTWSFGYGNNRFIAINNYAYTSSNGSSWSQISNSKLDCDSSGWSPSIKRATYGNGKFVILTSEGYYLYTNVSTDGVNWTGSKRIAEFSSVYNLGYGGGKFIIQYYFNSEYITLSSTDGLNWTKMLNVPGLAGIYGTTRSLISIGSSINYSTDGGVTWEKRNIPITSYVDFNYVDFTFTALSSTYGYVSFDNGLNWSKVNLPKLDTPISWNKFRYYKGLYILIYEGMNTSSKTEGPVVYYGVKDDDTGDVLWTKSIEITSSNKVSVFVEGNKVILLEVNSNNMAHSTSSWVGTIE